MTIFVVLFPETQPALAEAIKATFPAAHLAINDKQWLVSTTGTVIELTAKLRIYDAANPKAESTGNAVIFATSSYYGRAPSNIWDWIKSKLEAS